jgi:hypothetical protein
MPRGAKEFALAEWHYDYADHRCPHDSWIKSIEVILDERKQGLPALRLSVLGAFHDRVISIEYLGVVDFSLEGQTRSRLHGRTRLDLRRGASVRIG